MLGYAAKFAFILALAAASPAMTASVSAQESASAAHTAEPAWQEAPRSTGAPSARHENGAAALNGELFLIGGRRDQPLDIYNVAAGEWRQGAPAPVEMHHFQAAVWNDRIYVIGALTGSMSTGETVIDHVLVYDPATDSWSEGPELPAERQRGGGGLVLHEGVFYIVGGNRLGHEAGFVPWLDAFDPATGEWTQLPDAPHARDHFHAAILDGRIYAAGGRQSGHPDGGRLGVHVGEVDVYDIVAGSWSTAPDPIPTLRSGVSVIELGGRIIVSGGESMAQESAHAEVEAYDPAQQAWTSLPPMPVGRHGTQAVIIDNDIHIVAGNATRGGGSELTDHWVLTGVSSE